MKPQGREAAYQQLYCKFMTISPGLLQHYNLPLEVVTRDAEKLALAALEDKAALLAVGLKPQILETILEKAMALVQAAHKHQLAIERDPWAKQQWQDKSPRGYELRHYLIKFCSFAFRQDPTLSTRIENIKSGLETPDMINDLLKLYTLARDNQTLLTQLKIFDPTKITETKHLHDELHKIFTDTKIDLKEIKQTKYVLDCAHSFFKKDADEIILHGKFVFEGQIRKQRYSSFFHQQVRKPLSPPKMAFRQTTSPLRKIIL